MHVPFKLQGFNKVIEMQRMIDGCNSGLLYKQTSHALRITVIYYGTCARALQTAGVQQSHRNAAHDRRLQLWAAVSGG
jgi:hypothetical protein